MSSSHNGEHGETPSEPKKQLHSNSFINGIESLFNIFDGPATLLRKIIESTQRGRDTPYYHRVYNRVPTVDKCAYGDNVCVAEANEQYLRDRKVDKFITHILNERLRECLLREGKFEGFKKCQKLDEDYTLALMNYFIKYGELSTASNCIDVYMKQKHRLIWQRRNPDKDIIGFEKRKQILKEVGDYQRSLNDNIMKGGL